VSDVDRDQNGAWCCRHLSAQEFARARAMVVAYLAEHDFITNRAFRALTQLTYDQAVSCFNKMIADGDLLRVGKTTSTRYQLQRAVKSRETSAS
jgi:hypothetical protein